MKHVSKWINLSLDVTPPLATVRSYAALEGLEVVRYGDRYWLVRDEQDVSPQHGVTLDELWILVALPSDHERVKAVWAGE